MGMPRYLPRDGEEVNLRISHRDCLVYLSTLGEKYTLDLTSLIIWLERLQNSLRTSLMVEQLIWFALAKNIGHRQTLIEKRLVHSKKP